MANSKKQSNIFWITVGLSLAAIVALIFGAIFTNDKTGQLIDLTMPVEELQPVCIPKSTNSSSWFEYTQQTSGIIMGVTHFFYAGHVNRPWTLSYAKAYEVCHNISTESHFLSLLSNEEEEKFDDFYINFLDDWQSTVDILYDSRPQVWLEAHFNLEIDNATEIQWGHGDGPTSYFWNFCDPEAVDNHLAELRKIYRPGMNPIIYIVKDFSKWPLQGPYDSPKRGCWRIYDSIFNPTENIEMNWVCQFNSSLVFHQLVPEPKTEFTKVEIVNYTFMGAPLTKKVSRDYALFYGNISYFEARETCTGLKAGSSHMLVPNTKKKDLDIDRLVKDNQDRIFGTADQAQGNPEWRPLIWTGGYFNLSSNDTTRFRWVIDKNAEIDTAAKIPISYGLPWLNNDNTVPQLYENFCSPLTKLVQLMKDKKAQPRKMDTADGCVNGHLMIIVKDYRDEQTNKGCWHVYDLDYLYENNYKLFLMCQLSEND